MIGWKRIPYFETALHLTQKLIEIVSLQSENCLPEPFFFPQTSKAKNQGLCSRGPSNCEIVYFQTMG